MLPQIVEMAETGSSVDLISRALGISAEVVRDAPHLRRTGQRPPGRVDGRRRRKPGEGLDRLARDMNVSRGTILRAYDFANPDEVAAAAREGRKPIHPKYKWGDEPRAAKRKRQD
jgi:hypothetical protein